jgi:hypothetical protein
VAIALNLTAPLKQDPDSLQRLGELKDAFAERVQPAMDEALSRSQRVHFARVVVIDDAYVQVLTEFDGDPLAYTTFFLRELGPVFEQIFSLVQDAPPWEELQDENRFHEYASSLNLKSLGTSTDSGDDRGYLFSAVGDKTVPEIHAALGPEPRPVSSA